MVTATEIEVQLGRLAQLVERDGEVYLPFYERMEEHLNAALAREAEGQSARSRAKARARDTRLHRDPQVAAMLA